MGQKKFVAIDLSQEAEQEEYKPKKTKAPKKEATAEVAPEPTTEPKKKKTEVEPVLSESGKDMSHLLADDEPSEASAKEGESPKTRSKKQTKAIGSAETEAATTESKTTKKPTQKKSRSRRYRDARAQVDRTRTYPLGEAVTLVKKTSVARFDASVEAHLNVTETGLKAEIQFPHSTGRTTKVAIADDKLLEDIAAGKLDFDVLLATPDMMPKLAKHAKVLGPKGLMPNPKSGTITSDPEKKKKEMAGGKTLVRTEPKAPLVHVVTGKISMPETQLAANIKALINGLLPKNISKLTLSSTMGPGVKVDLREFKD